MKVPFFLIILVIAVVAGGVVLASSAYRVYETEQVIVTQFGAMVGEPVTDAGLHFKLPFIQDLHYLDKRILEWDGDPNEIPTRDKLFIYVDTFARWRIADPKLYFQRVRDEISAQTRLDDILDGETRNAIANHDLIEIVRTSNREPMQDAALVEAGAQINTLETIEQGRSDIAGRIKQRGQERLSDLGIELLDIQFKRINYNQSVQQKIYERMISEREQIADKFRSEGEGEAARIQGEKERDLRVIQSEAYKEVEQIRGDADARAIEIYARAYNQTEEAAAFYRFLKSMEVYEATFDGQFTTILTTGSDLFEYLNGTGDLD